MPLHDYTKRIYETAGDSAYIVRFLDYLICKRYRRTTFTINGTTTEPLITGVLENVKTKERYNSLAHFYNTVTGSKEKEKDVSLLSKINVTKEYTVMRIICNIPEEYIIEFFDQKYRSFLMYRDVRKRIKDYVPIDAKQGEPLVNSEVTLVWDNSEYKLSHTTITCNDITNPYRCYKLLEGYEDGFVEGLYYCSPKGHHLITDK